MTHEYTQLKNHERADVFVAHFKHILFHTLTHRDEMVQALISRANLFKDKKPPSVEVLTADFDTLITDLDKAGSINDAGDKALNAGSYSFTHPTRIMSAIKLAGFSDEEIHTFSNSNIVLTVAAIFHSFTLIAEDIDKLTPKFPKNKEKDAVEFQMLDEDGLMKTHELQQLIIKSCNKVCKEVIDAYFQSKNHSQSIAIFPDNKQAYQNLLKEIGSEYTAHVITVTPPVSETPNTPLPDTSWTTRFRQIGLTLLALVAIVTVGYFTFPLILPLVGAVLATAATAVTWVILVVAAVAIAGVFFGLNEFIKWVQSHTDSNEPPAEAQQMLKIDKPSNQMSGLVNAINSTTVIVPPDSSLGNRPSEDATKENKPEDNDQKKPHPK